MCVCVCVCREVENCFRKLNAAVPSSRIIRYRGETVTGVNVTTTIIMHLYTIHGYILVLFVVYIIPDQPSTARGTCLQYTRACTHTQEQYNNGLLLRFLQYRERKNYEQLKLCENKGQCLNWTEFLQQIAPSSILYYNVYVI